MLAPFDNPEWTIWGTSPGNQGILPRTDAWFEMHCNLLWPQYKSYGEPYLRWLNEQKFPVMAQDNSMIPRAVPYPIREILERFGRPEPFFFTSTFAYCMAFAIMQQVEEIGLYGVDMSSKDEYILQRSGGHHFACVADDHGIKVTVPPESDLLQPPPLYGYSDATPWGRKMAARAQEVKERITALEQQVNGMQQQLVYLKGADEDISYVRQVYGSVDQFGQRSNWNGKGNGGMPTPTAAAPMQVWPTWQGPPPPMTGPMGMPMGPLQPLQLGGQVFMPWPPPSQITGWPQPWESNLGANNGRPISEPQPVGPVPVRAVEQRGDSSGLCAERTSSG